VTRALPLLLLLACVEAKEAAGKVAGTAVEYIACPFPWLDCGHVFLCAAEADNALHHVEICVDDDSTETDQLALAELTYGTCVPTPRHQGICLFCPEKSGCNAFNGCFNCPESP
jgi:hypothetical protein